MGFNSHVSIGSGIRFTVKSLIKVTPKSPNLKDSHLILQLSLSNPLKPGVKWRNENEDAVGAAPTGDAPTTSEWSTILLPTMVWLILEILQYIETNAFSASLTAATKTNFQLSRRSIHNSWQVWLTNLGIFYKSQTPSFIDSVIYIILSVVAMCAHADNVSWCISIQYLLAVTDVFDVYCMA